MRRPEHAERLQLSRHESVLGAWMEATLEPHPALHGVVERIWFGEGRTAYRRDRILPRGAAYLLINLGPPQLLVDLAGGPPRVFDDVWFCGPHDRFLETEAPSRVRMLGVAFTPHGANRLLRHRQSELTNRVVELAALFGDRARSLRESLLEGSPEQRLGRLEEWLLQQVASAAPTRPVVCWAVDRLARAHGRLRVEELAAESGYSRKHLSQLFREEVGLTPKTLGRIYRFHLAVELLRRSSGRDGCRIALDCGYYDQSHLLRDLQGFAGAATGELGTLPAPDQLTLVVG